LEQKRKEEKEEKQKKEEIRRKQYEKDVREYDRIDGSSPSCRGSYGCSRRDSFYVKGDDWSYTDYDRRRIIRS